MNRGQEFVIGGYFPGPHGFDSLIVGYYDGDNLMYVARTRNGFVPASRRQVFSKLKHLVTPSCPFVNLPETRRSRFGEELNAEKMKKAIWLRPESVAQIEFLEWTEGDRLRHSKFVGLREDKNPSKRGQGASRRALNNFLLARYSLGIGGKGIDSHEQFRLGRLVSTAQAAISRSHHAGHNLMALGLPGVPG